MNESRKSDATQPLGRRLFSAVRGDRQGATTAMFVGMLLGLLGMGALVVDLGQMYVTRSRLQGVADASALAAVVAPSPGLSVVEATTYAALNYPDGGTVVDTSDVISGCWIDNDFVPMGTSPCIGTTLLNAVQVTARRSEDNNNPLGLILMPLFGEDVANIAATSIAWEQPVEQQGCIYQMNPAAHPFGIRIRAGTTVRVCRTIVNATHATDALSVQGNATLISNVKVWMSESAGPPNVCLGCTLTPSSVERKPFVSDPLESVPPPSTAGPCGSFSFNTTGTVGSTNPAQVNIICGGIGISGGKVITFRPGVYVVRGGGINVSGGGTMIGTDVMFYLTCTTAPCNGSNSGGLQIGQGGTGCPGTRPVVMQLSAPTTGTYQGILFFQDRTASTTSHSFNGPRMDLDGIFYLPKDELSFTGAACFPAFERVAFVVGALDIANGSTVEFLPLLFPPAPLNMGGLKIAR